MKYPQAEHTLIRCESREHNAIRCGPSELCDEQKGAHDDMKDHMVFRHVRIFPNPRRLDQVTSGCSKEKLLTTNNHQEKVINKVQNL